MSLALSNIPWGNPCVVTSSEMQLIDQAVMRNYFLSSRVLMEHAGMACVHALLKTEPYLSQIKVTILAGSGHNGGDGVVMGRILHGLGFCVEVFAFSEPLFSDGDLAGVWNSFQSVGGAVSIFQKDSIVSEFLSAIPSESVVVDALSGTGFKGSPREVFKEVVGEVVRRKNNDGIRIYSIDLPSGNSADEGSEEYAGIEATQTWALQCFKPIHVSSLAEKVTGESILLDITIPFSVVEQNSYPRRLITPRLAGDILKRIFPERSDTHKGKRGHVLVIGGASGMEGAPVLTSHAALRSGAGLVTMVRPKGSEGVLVRPEIMQKIPPRSDKGSFGPFDKDFWEEVLGKKQSIVIGPGFGTNDDSRHILEYVISYSSLHSVPLVIDADAISILSSLKPLMSSLASHMILTPHPGEFSRLTGYSVHEIQSKRMTLSHKFTSEHEVVLLLKGAYTVVSAKEYQYISPYQEPVLGVAGSGDTLSGILGALLGKKLSTLEASVLSVFLHAEAGRVWAFRNLSQSGLFVSELSDLIPELLHRIVENSNSCFVSNGNYFRE
jgi:ADP-dependent NAD(P)H-hydrate dehydratase / NAD(P)H-hydrate epimerase